MPTRAAAALYVMPVARRRFAATTASWLVFLRAMFMLLVRGRLVDHVDNRPDEATALDEAAQLLRCLARPQRGSVLEHQLSQPLDVHSVCAFARATAFSRWCPSSCARSTLRR